MQKAEREIGREVDRRGKLGLGPGILVLVLDVAARVVGTAGVFGAAVANAAGRIGAGRLVMVRRARARDEPGFLVRLFHAVAAQCT